MPKQINDQAWIAVTIPPPTPPSELPSVDMHYRSGGGDDADDHSANTALIYAGGQLYTPAMLAEILGLSVRVIRRWHRAGLLQATAEVLQLPYFDFSQLATARQLARWMQQGATVQSIQQQLQLLRQRVEQQLEVGDLIPEPLSIENLPITADGKRLVLRSGDHFLEASGQLRFGFEATSDEERAPTASVVPFQKHKEPLFPLVSHGSQTHPSAASGPLSLQDMMNEALVAEDNEDLASAIDWCRAAMAAHGVNADVCFQLAELLYRTGDLSGARERYFVALEVDPSLVEARANLGCILAECGEPELAVAAFEGTLEQYADYADVHFHLARTLEDLGQTSGAIEHWRQFLRLSPASPWAEEATERLGQLAPLLEF